jgi:hypothetical protein
MSKHLYLALSLVLLLVGLQACDSANPVAPSTSMLFISASPTQIPLRGTSLITVTGFKPDGNPLNRGTQIVFEATFGTIEPRIAEVDNNGRTTAVFTSDGTLPPGGGGENPQSAAAEVKASLAGSGGGGGGEGGGTGGGPSVAVEIQIGETKPLLTLTVSPNVLSLGETAEVFAQVRNADGSNFGAGGRVQLRTNLGTLASSSLVTDATGEARTTFSSGNDPGTATITGFVGSGDEVTTDVTIENQRPVLIVTANPSVIPIRGESTITVIARDNNGQPLGAGQRIRFTSDLGAVDPDVRFTNSAGEATATFTAGDRAGTGEVTAILGSSDPAMVQITIRDAPASLDFRANPTVVPQGQEARIDLQAVALNAQGDPVASATVVFNADIGGSFESGSNVHTTNPQGQATDTLIVPETELVGRNSFTVSATVRGEGAEITRSVTISIRQ